MKTATEQVREITTTGDFKTSKMTVNMTEQAFQVLSSAMYTDKPLAIVRELSCNAMDAHIDAKVKSKPFEVCLPNYDQPTFSIRDYGFGLNDHDVRYVFAGFFNSSKTHTNMQTGGFGIGSKSPFSYTEMFSIVSYHGGKKSCYVAMLGEDGTPEISLTSTSDTTETGLEVSFPVKERDFSLFGRAAERALRPFRKDSYKVYGQALNIEDYKAIFKGSNFIFTNLGNRFIVRMGNVDYFIDNDAFLDDIEKLVNSKGIQSYSNTYTIPQFCKQKGMVVTVPIGTVSPAPSREVLQMDRKTVKALAEVCKNAWNEYKKELDDSLASCTTVKEYRRKFTDLFYGPNAAYADMVNAYTPSFQGQPVEIKLPPQPIKLNGQDNVWVYIGKVQSYYGGGFANSFSHAHYVRELCIADYENLDIYIDDVSKSNDGSGGLGTSSLNNYISDFATKAHSYIYLLPSQCGGNTYSKTYPTDQDYKKMCKHLGLDYSKAIKVSTLPVKPKAAKPKPAKTVKCSTDLKKYERGVYTLSRNSYASEIYRCIPATVDLTAGGYYIAIDRPKLLLHDQFTGVHVNGQQLIKAAAEALPGIRIYGLSAQTVVKATRDGKGWKNVLSVLRNRFHTLLQEKTIQAYQKSQAIKDNEERKYFKVLLEDKNLLLTKIQPNEDSIFVKATLQWDEIFSNIVTAEPPTLSEFNTLATLFQIEVQQVPIKKTEVDFGVFKHYPLLGVLGATWFQQKAKFQGLGGPLSAVELSEHMCAYIKMIDNQNKEKE